MTEKVNDMDADLRSRVVALEHQGAGYGQRLTGLEAWQRQKDIDSARHDERWKHMDDRFTRIETSIEGVRGALTRVMWIVITGIIGAVLAFMVQGGFSP